MKKTSVRRQKPAKNTLAGEALALFMDLQHKQLVQLGKDFGAVDAEKFSEKLSTDPPITRDEPGVGRLEIGHSSTLQGLDTLPLEYIYTRVKYSRTRPKAISGK